MAGATRICCQRESISACSVDTIHRVSSCKATYVRCMRVLFSCNLPPALLAEWLGFLRATAVTRGWMDTEIRVSTENWPWRRKFSRCSSRDSNPRPFNHKFGTLTTELSLLPKPKPKGQVAGYTYRLHLQLCGFAWSDMVHGVHKTHRDSSSFMWHQFFQHCNRKLYITLVDIKKMYYKKLVIHVTVESHDIDMWAQWVSSRAENSAI